ESSTTASQLKKGDVITRVGDQQVRDGLELFQKLNAWKSGELSLVATSDGQTRQVNLYRQVPEKSKPDKLGIVFSSVTETKRLGLLAALKGGPGLLLKSAARPIVLLSTAGKRATTGTSLRSKSTLAESLDATSFLSMAL